MRHFFLQVNGLEVYIVQRHQLAAEMGHPQSVRVKIFINFILFYFIGFAMMYHGVQGYKENA
jgi:hypothetical protein